MHKLGKGVGQIQNFYALYLINTAKSLMETFVNRDLAASKTKLLALYADTAKVHDNKNTQKFAENIDTYMQLRNSGVKFSIIQTPIVWETV